MSIILILAALCFAAAIGLYVKYKDSTNDGDMWAGVALLVAGVAGIVLLGIAAVWWASQHIFFK